MGGGASLARAPNPSLFFLQNHSAAAYKAIGFDEETVKIAQHELSKPPDASELKTREEKLCEIRRLRRIFRRMYDDGVHRSGTIIRQDDGRVMQNIPGDYRSQLKHNDEQTIHAELKSATAYVNNYYDGDPKGPDNALEFKVPPGHVFDPPERHCTQRMSLKEMFRHFDKNGDGSVSTREWMDALNEMGIIVSDQDAKEAMANLDEDHNGTLSLDEFVDFVEDLSSRTGSEDVETRLKDIVKATATGIKFNEYVRHLWALLNKARVKKQSLLAEKSSLEEYAQLNGQLNYHLPMRLTQELVIQDTHINMLEHKYFRATRPAIQPALYQFDDTPENEVTIVYVGEVQEDEVAVGSIDPEPEGQTIENHGATRAFYELFMIRQSVILPRSPPRQSNMEAKEAFVTVPEEVDQMNEMNLHTDEKLATDIFVLVMDEDIETAKLTLPKILLSSDFRIALPELREHLMTRWNLDATCLRYIPDADGSGRRILEMELHDNMWEPTIRTGNTRWETMKYLQDANLDDVHSKLVWDQLNEIMGQITVVRSPWEQQGWWTFTSRWMTEHLRKQGIQQTDYIVQQRLSKNSVVMTMESTVGTLYFKCSLEGFEASISKFLAETKMWRKHVPFVIASDHERRWVFQQEISQRLTMEDVGDRDGEDEGSSDNNQAVAEAAILAYERGEPILLRPLPAPSGEEGSLAKSVSRWKLFFEEFANLQMDADYRMVRFKECGWAVLDDVALLKQWAGLLNDRQNLVNCPLVPADLLLSAAQVNLLQEFTSKVETMYNELNNSKLPPEALHFPFRPCQVVEAVVKTRAPRPANMFSFYGVDRSVIAHPFLTIQPFFDYWPCYDAPKFCHVWKGDFDGPKEEELWLHRRGIRDHYLKCWALWEKSGRCRKLFNVARKLFQVTEACRYWHMIRTGESAAFDEARLRILILKRLKIVLDIIEQSAEMSEETEKVIPANDGLRPVIPWKNGTISVESEDGRFKRQVMLETSAISVSDLIWDEVGMNEDEAEVKSPRVRGIYVGFDLDLHQNGIRDGDTITFKLTVLEKLEEKDDDGRLPDVFKPWPDLPPVVVYDGGIVRRPKKPDILMVEDPTPESSVRQYLENSEKAELQAKTLDKTFRQRRGY
eukprot:Stramenopile-MAST_4_protein_662